MKSKSLIILLLPFAIACNSNSQSVSDSNPETTHVKTAEELRAELLLNEQQAPLNYLQIIKDNNYSMKRHQVLVEKHIFRADEYKDDGFIFNGVIKNSATLASFKDAIVHVKYVSPTLSVIEEQDYTIYRFLPPNDTIHFSIKVNPNEAFETFSSSIKNALIK